MYDHARRLLPALIASLVAAAAFAACGDDEGDGTGAGAGTTTGTAGVGGGQGGTGNQGGAGNQGGTTTGNQGGSSAQGGQGGQGGSYVVSTVCVEACQALVACNGAGGGGGGTTLLECTPPCNESLSTCSSSALGEVLDCVSSHLDTVCDELAYWSCVDNVPCVGVGVGGGGG